MRVTITIEDGDVSINEGGGGVGGPYIKGPYIKGPSLVIPREGGGETEVNIDKLAKLVEKANGKDTPGG